MRIAFLAFFLLIGCVSKPEKPTVLQLPPIATTNELLFPYGHYRHHLTLEILHGEDGQSHRYSFDGVAETTPEKIQLVMLSPFNTTLMKVHEDRKSGEVRLETYDSKLRRFENKFVDYYAMLRKIFLSGPLREGKASITRKLLNEKGELLADLTYSEFKEHVPRHVEVKNKFFTLDIEVEPL
jgi:hypothetical protein